MNKADEMYYLLYDLVINQTLGAYPFLINSLHPYIKVIMIIAIAIIGMRMLWGHSDLSSTLKSLIAVIIINSILLNAPFFLENTRDIFIDGPVTMGENIVNAMSNTTNNSVDLQVVPNGETSAIGALWRANLTLAFKVMDSAGWTDPGPAIIGAIIYLSAVILLTIELMIMGAFFIVIIVAIFTTPVFLPMFLFKGTRRIFEGWLNFGLSASFGLLFIITVLGIIYTFTYSMFQNMFGVALTDDLNSIDTVNLENVGLFLVLIYIAIKILPHTFTWGSSIGGVTASGISDGIQHLGNGFNSIISNSRKKSKDNKPRRNLETDKKRGIRYRASQFKQFIQDKFQGDNYSKTRDNKPRTHISRGDQAKTKAIIKQRLKTRGLYNKNRPLSKLSANENKINRLKRARLIALPSPNGGYIKGSSISSATSSKEKIAAIGSLSDTTSEKQRVKTSSRTDSANSANSTDATQSGGKSSDKDSNQEVKRAKTNKQAKISPSSNNKAKNKATSSKQNKTNKQDSKDISRTTQAQKTAQIEDSKAKLDSSNSSTSAESSEMPKSKGVGSGSSSTSSDKPSMNKTGSSESPREPRAEHDVKRSVQAQKTAQLEASKAKLDSSSSSTGAESSEMPKAKSVGIGSGSTLSDKPSTNKTGSSESPREPRAEHDVKRSVQAQKSVQRDTNSLKDQRAKAEESKEVKRKETKVKAEENKEVKRKEPNAKTEKKENMKKSKKDNKTTKKENDEK